MGEVPGKSPLDLGRKTDSLREAPEAVMTARIRQANEERRRKTIRKEIKEP